MPSELTVVIVTFNSREVIEKCLDGLVSNRDASIDEIMVIDNASKDGTDDLIAERYPSVKLVRMPFNIGYGRAANEGLRRSATRYTLLINPDVITDGETIQKLLSEARNYNRAAIFAPLTRTDKEPETQDDIQGLISVDWVSGAVMLFDMNLLNKVGYFDDDIFLFYEETDLCHRVRKAGYDIILFQNIMMHHLVGKSSPSSDKILRLKYWHMGWSLFYYNKKNFPAKYLSLVNRSLAKYILKIIFYSVSMDRKKRIKYFGLLSGGMAFLAGKKAFDENGRAQLSAKL